VCLALLLAACTAQPPSSFVLVPTSASPLVESALPSPESAFRELAIRAPSELLPSPDGQMLAALDRNRGEIYLYDASARITATAPLVGGARWLPDGSGLFLLAGTGDKPSSHRLGIIDRNGTLSSLPVDLTDPALSPDSRWIAGTTSAGLVDVLPRHGGLVSSIGSGGRFLGWLGGQVVYGNAQVVDRQWLDTPPSLIGPVGALGELSVPLRGASPSPDDTATVAVTSLGTYVLISRDRLLPLASEVETGGTGLSPLLWVSGHQAVGRGSATNLLVVDVLTGDGTQVLGCTTDGLIEAIAGSRIAIDEQGLVKLCDLSTGAETVVGVSPIAGLIYSWGVTFLLHGGGRTFVFG
jgi:hypothetical protein